VHTEDWTEHQFKEGPTCFFCHVKIPSSYHHLFNPPSDKEVSGLWDTWDEEATATSRLACQIKLDKRMDGMTVFVVDAPVTF
jgi:ferredoxin